MVNFFKKVGKDTSKFFQKAKSDAPKIFQKVAGGIGSASKVLGQVADVGEKVVSQVEKSPFGGVLAPATTLARGVISSARLGSELGYMGKSALKDVQRGNIQGTLEKAKQIQRKGEEGRGIKFA